MNYGEWNHQLLKIIREARDLISDESRWTQGALARNISGEPTISFGGEAVCWCALGALNYAFSRQKVLRDLDEVIETFRALGFRKKHITDINDLQGHEPVLRVFDQVINRLEEIVYGHATRRS